MKNVKLDISSNKLTITIDLSQTNGLSKSGKSLVIASTEGNQKIETAFGEIHLGVNAYKMLDKK